MNDPIYGDDLVVRLQGGTVRELTARRFGPAGVSRVELQPGLILAVDAAEPSLLASMTVDLSTTSPDILSDLIGAARSSALLQMKVSGDGRPKRLPADTDDWANSGRRGFQSRPNPNNGAQLTGKCVGHLSIARSSSKDELVRLVSALEAIEAVDEMWQANALTNLLGDNARQAVRQLSQESDAINQLIRTLDPDLRNELVELLERYSSTFPELNGIDAESKVGDRAEVSDSVVGFPSSGSLQQGLAPRGQRPRLKSQSRVSDEWIQLAFSRFQPGYWIRVLHPATQELVSLVPLKRGPGNTGIAHVFVPPDHLVTKTFAYDVTLTPIRASGDAVSSVIGGVRMGYRALDLSRRGARYEAFKLWEECADLWERVGDSARARLAREYGRDGVPALVNTLSARVDRSSHFEP